MRLCSASAEGQFIFKNTLYSLLLRDQKALDSASRAIILFNIFILILIFLLYIAGSLLDAYSAVVFSC
jgi:hypothetical protein